MAQSALFADTIVLRDGGEKNGRVARIGDGVVEFDPGDGVPRERVEIGTVRRIVYDNGRTAEFTMNEPGAAVEDGNGSCSDSCCLVPNISLVKEDSVTTGLLALPLRLSLYYMQGTTDVGIYDAAETKVADGSADYRQYLVSLSYNPLVTDFYLTPQLGYFFRKIIVKDYSYDVAEPNTGINGYIPGIITNPVTGEELPRSGITSLAYEAAFHTVFLDLKAGAQLVGSWRKVQILINPYASAGLVELRKSAYVFDLPNYEEEYSRPFKAAWLSSYGAGCEAGFFITALRTGLSVGYDWRHFRKFEMPEGVRFKQAYLDESTGLVRTREIAVKYTDITARLVTFTLYTFI